MSRSVEQRLAALEAALANPQALRNLLERTFDPRGEEPRIIDADGNTLDFQGAIQFLNATSVVDGVNQRIVVTPTGGSGGGHVILDPDTGAPMPTEPALFLVASNPTGALNLTGVDAPGVASAILFTLAATIERADVQVFDTAGSHTWTKPGNALNTPDWVMVLGITPGAGGGGGSRTDPPGGTTAGGGGGGGGGGLFVRYARASDLSATESVVLGAPGAPGAPAAGVGDGGFGGDGGDTYFRDHAFSGIVSAATGGEGGRSIGAAAAGGTGCALFGAGGGFGGDSEVAGTAGAKQTSPGAGGGGGGGSFTGTGLGAAGGASGPAGGPGGGGVLSDGIAAGGQQSGSGGGGGDLGSTSGGDGALYGGGGGGAGGVHGGSASAGGAGGDGIIVVVTQFSTYALS